MAPFRAPLASRTDRLYSPRRMRTHLRQSSVFSLTVLAAALLSACGGTEPPIEAPRPVLASAPAAPSSPRPVASTANAIAPAPLDVDPTAAEMTREGMAHACDASLKRAELIWEGVRLLAKEPAPLTWENTMSALDAVHLSIRNAADFAELMSVTHPDKGVVAAAKDCGPKVERLLTSIRLDDATATVVKRFAAQPMPVKAPIPSSWPRYVERMVKELKRNGADLDAPGKARLRQLNEELSLAMQEFQGNIAGSTLSIEVDPKSLDGLPESYVAKHPKGANGKVRLTTDYPDFFPFMQFAKDRAAALELYTKFDNRAADKNVAVLDKILRLRREKAKLLGYATWADFVLEMRMAKNPATVATFLDDLKKHLAPIVKTEMAELEAAHVKLGGKKGESIPPSDRLYLEEVVRKAKYGVDAKEVSEYFEVERVRQGLLDITGQLFGIKYREVPAKAWHADVRTYEVLDGDKTIGRFSMDLHPREGKYKHAAVFSIRDTRKMDDGSRLMPIAAIVCNFPKTSGETPGLMTHQEVSTFFHEFGHVLHHLLSTAELSSFAGTNVSRDFVEAPSQMLEEWTWSKPVLDRFAKHWKTGKPMPAGLFDKMTKGRAFGRAITTQRQLFLASLDQAYHATSEPAGDTTATVKDVWSKTMPFRYVEGTHFQATFGHLMEYDAGYYGYQWALAIARDLYSRFEKEGLMTPATALDYRAKVLAPGSSDDEGKLVEAFLGRPFSRDPYKRFLALGARK